MATLTLKHVHDFICYAKKMFISFYTYWKWWVTRKLIGWFQNWFTLLPPPPKKLHFIQMVPTVQFCFDSWLWIVIHIALLNKKKVMNRSFILYSLKICLGAKRESDEMKKWNQLTHVHVILCTLYLLYNMKIYMENYTFFFTAYINIYRETLEPDTSIDRTPR